MPHHLLDTPIEYLKGVGPQRGELLKKELSIFTYSDLLYYYPFRYIDRTQFYKISSLKPELPMVQVLGRVVSKEIIGEKQKKRLVALLKDDTGLLELVWFQGIKWIDSLLQPGLVFIVFGKPSSFNGKLSMSHPELELYDPENKKPGNLALQPVYGSTEKLKQYSLDSKGIQRLTANLLQVVLSHVPETLPDYILQQYRLISKRLALQHIHFPSDVNLMHAAQQRIKFEELFFIQLKLLRNKTVLTRKYKGLIFGQVGDKFNTFYNERLPFELTGAQKRVIKEIRQDTQRGVQMNRLLQGDVGSGKTAVALMCMLLAIDNGFQACMMAPTEILAQQHYLSLEKLLGDNLATIALLTGSTPKKQRKIIHAELENGNINILIGTHALIEDTVKFNNLGLVVIDEQHRFGVEQRAKLWTKNHVPPHILVMTATPIPRTLAMTLYGDLDVSVIDELPVGRKPIKTIHLYESQRLRMFGFMREEIAKGRQVYIVYPLIKESEKLDLLHLEAGIEAISQEFPLPQYRISIVHGKLSASDKEAEMQRFARGETQIMVATTVIEVGVNVPNASVMIIENAERFGLSQLHQLRGRVGRGAEQSYCILMSGSKLSKDARIRLDTMVRTNNGFEISEIDMQLRGPGDIEGTRQSGVLDLKLADLVTDQAILQTARDCVIRIFDEDPDLSSEKNRLLWQYFNQREHGLVWNKIS
ncbi:ATP-dependent DNA helicase RecG (plasmid) [Pedobacter sp. BS3]|uniref:ATP-dependent DNA helicase RecG n=1 Tax=Pedobacter sp. BS3 TaxID=2567937 RepID=UPI0011EBA4DB|nr:ATP-dependent DNA helicase RecG [Pedobacter sp. BS3]TZF86114.1 ATP-dependent DNA helicase RecG [Pedobacter sp. BS3]